MPLIPHANPERASADLKTFARSLFTHVMGEVNVAKRMRDCLVLHGSLLQIGTDFVELRAFSRVVLAAIGKAAVPMSEHALEVLQSTIPLSGVVVGTGPWQPPQGILYFRGGHPLPNDESFVAGAALLRAMQPADAETLVLFLISGGASAMAESPLDSTLPREEIVAFYRALLHSGLAIAETNTLRKHLSALKGGRLGLAAAGATLCTLLLSDVPAGRLDVVGSGPSLPDVSTREDCLRLLAETASLNSISPRIRSFFRSAPETPKALPAGRFPSICFAALSSDSMVKAAEDFAASAGYRVRIDHTCDDWDYREAALYLLRRAKRERRLSGPVCLISAGEVTVSIPGQAGEGGRNQQWALEVARHLSGEHGIAALSAGSDGIDGNSPAAGAVVDGYTWSRSLALGVDPQQALDSFNTYPLFARLGDAVLEGPTGNNLRDLRVLLMQA